MVFDTGTSVPVSEAKRDMSLLYSCIWNCASKMEAQRIQPQADHIICLMNSIQRCFTHIADREEMKGNTRDTAVILLMPMNTFSLETMCVQAYGAGVRRKITKDSDCCLAGTLMRRSGGNAAIKNRWTAKRIERKEGRKE